MSFTGPHWGIWPCHLLLGLNDSATMMQDPHWPFNPESSTPSKQVTHEWHYQVLLTNQDRFWITVSKASVCYCKESLIGIDSWGRENLFTIVLTSGSLLSKELLSKELTFVQNWVSEGGVWLSEYTCCCPSAECQGFLFFKIINISNNCNCSWTLLVHKVKSLHIVFS